MTLMDKLQDRVRSQPPSLVATVACLEHVRETILQRGFVVLHLYQGAQIDQLAVFLSSEYQKPQRNFQT
jgi:hypothetical protein